VLHIKDNLKKNLIFYSSSSLFNVRLRKKIHQLKMKATCSGKRQTWC